MNCPHKDSLMPRCDVASHPHKQDIDYCRVCGEWRDVNKVGSEFPDLLWLLLALGMTWFIFSQAQLSNQPEPSIPQESSQQQRF